MAKFGELVRLVSDNFIDDFKHLELTKNPAIKYHFNSVVEELGTRISREVLKDQFCLGNMMSRILFHCWRLKEFENDLRLIYDCPSDIFDVYEFILVFGL